MPTITASQTASFTVDAFGSIAVVVNGQGALTATSRAQNLKSNVVVSVLQSKTYGPFGVPMDVVISCSDGSITYTVTNGYGGGATSADAVSIADAGGYFTGTDVEAALQELGAAVGGGSLNTTQTISATGTGAAIPTLGATRVSLEFSTEVGTVYQAHVSLENADTGALIGVVYWPSTGTRWFDLPGGTDNVQFETTYWSDAGGTDTVNLTVAG